MCLWQWRWCVDQRKVAHVILDCRGEEDQEDEEEEGRRARKKREGGGWADKIAEREQSVCQSSIVDLQELITITPLAQCTLTYLYNQSVPSGIHTPLFECYHDS
jgi:hypothetical protein